MEVLHPYKILSFARLLDFSRWMNNDNNKLGNFSSSSSQLSLARFCSFFSSQCSLMLLLSRISQSDSLYYYLSGFKWTQSRMRSTSKRKTCKNFFMNFFYGQNWARKKKESLGETQMCVESNSSGVHIFIAFDERKWRSEKNTARRRCEIEEIEERVFRSRLSVQGKIVRRRKGKLKKNCLAAWHIYRRIFASCLRYKKI